MAVKPKPEKQLSVNERLWRVLTGEPSGIKSAEGSLSTLYRTITSGLNVKPVGYRKGLDSLIDHMAQTGEITKSQKAHKHGNLNNGLCADAMTWKFFIDGLRLLILIPKMKIKKVKFQVVIEREVSKDATEEYVFSTVVHEDK